jgi:Holliday junction DNA helicase RuvB
MSDDEGRLVSGKNRTDDRENIALRPKMLRELIGQDSVREQLKIIIEAAMGRKEPVDHLLFYGPPGLGTPTSASPQVRQSSAPATSPPSSLT